MTAHLNDWLQLAVRWLHVIAGIVWIGTSFYFVWLNNHVKPSAESPNESDAELWAVHGGAFYRVMKYQKPARLPEVLHWFKWEAYTTWLSGFSLMVLIFYLDADLYLIDPARADISPLVAAAIGIGVLVVGWLVYDLLSRSSLLEKAVAFATVSLVLTIGVTLGLSLIFTSRGAYIHVGALLGTLMAGNVFFVIIPSQREMVTAMEEGREPDVSKGEHAALRSLHNNYLTLPVAFIMISSHFPFTYEYDQGWAILAGLIVIGAAVRHYFNLRGQGHRNVWLMPAAALSMIALGFVTLPHNDLPVVDPSEVSFEDGVGIIRLRCTTCHQSTPTHPAFSEPPKGVTFNNSAEMVTLAPRIRAMAVDSETMPLGNVTQMTQEERARLQVWLDEYTDG